MERVRNAAYLYLFRFLAPMKGHNVPKLFDPWIQGDSVGSMAFKTRRGRLAEAVRGRRRAQLPLIHCCCIPCRS